MIKNISRAFVFPGQGSQIIGMGVDFFQEFSTAKLIFQNIDEITQKNLSNIIFNGPAEELILTTNTQPALMATSIAILKVILEQSNKKINQLCSYVAGHSLGEYSALCASEAISLTDTTKLLMVRSSAMENACKETNGSMAACLGIDVSNINDLIKKYSDKNNQICQIANDNVLGQIVISGHNKTVNEIVDDINKQGYKAIKLNVSGAFHSNLMKPAVYPMTKILKKTNIVAPIVPLIANVNAALVNDPITIEKNLIAQIYSTVKWRQTMDKLESFGINELVEIGSLNVLSSIAKRVKPRNFKIKNISNIKEMEQFIESII